MYRVVEIIVFNFGTAQVTGEFIYVQCMITNHRIIYGDLLFFNLN
jgi:hypothetical protein